MGPIQIRLSRSRLLPWELQSDCNKIDKFVICPCSFFPINKFVQLYSYPSHATFLIWKFIRPHIFASVRLCIIAVLSSAGHHQGDTSYGIILNLSCVGTNSLSSAAVLSHMISSSNTSRTIYYQFRLPLNVSRFVASHSYFVFFCSVSMQYSCGWNRGINSWHIF